MDVEAGSELWSWKQDSGGRKDRPAEMSGQEGVRLDVVDVCYSVTIDKKTKQLLRNVNLRLDPGEMCALMGPSGAGKR